MTDREDNTDPTIETSLGESCAPKSIGPYALERMIARGTRESVYLARRMGMPETFAVKVFSGWAQPTPAQRSRFMVDASDVLRLSHPTIVPLIDAGSSPEAPYFTVCALVDCVPLRQVWLENPGPPVEAARMVGALARGLARVHARKRLHLDLNLNQFVIDREMMPRWFADQIVRPPEPEGARPSPMGNPGHLSPEQIRGDAGKIGPASDIYSLGLTLYELLAFQRPFQHQGGLGLCNEIMLGTFAPPSSQRPEVPRALDAICQCAMAREPGDRFASMEKMAEALEAAANSIQPGVILSRPLGRSNRRKYR